MSNSLSSISPPWRVIFVDDDTLYAETLTTELSERGFSVRHFSGAETLLAALDQVAEADIILLDWQMPNVSGIKLLSVLRRHGIRMPVVFLTGYNLAEYERQAFERGAMDFVAKSRGVETLAMRLRRVIETAASNSSRQPLVEGKLTLYRHVSRGTWNGVDLDLTTGEYNIVELLVLNIGSYLSYRAIYDVLRGPGFVSSRSPEGYRTNLRSAIKRLRNKIRAVDPTFAEIESYMSFGYRWRAGESPAAGRASAAPSPAERS